MSTFAPAVADPFAQLAARRRLRPVIEKLATECLAEVLSHRPPLAAWAATPPTELDAWVDAAWIARGAVGRDGARHRLAAVRVGSTWRTSAAAMARFVAALSADPAPASSPEVRSPASRRRAGEVADAALTAMGV